MSIIKFYEVLHKVIVSTLIVSAVVVAVFGSKVLEKSAINPSDLVWLCSAGGVIFADIILWITCESLYQNAVDRMIMRGGK